MKPSKVVKDYIRAEVEKKFAPMLTTAEEEYNKTRANLKAIGVKIAKEANEKFKQELEYVNLSDCVISNGWSAPQIVFSEGNFPNAKFVKEYNQLKTKVRAKIEESVNNILVELELGGTKEDIKNMLAQIDTNI